MIIASFAKLTATNYSVVLVGTIFNGALGLVFYSLAGRLLGPGEFGLLFITISFLTLTTDLIDLGTNSSVIKFVPSLVRNNPLQAYRFIKLGFKIKLLAWGVTALLSILSPLFARHLFAKPELSRLIQLALLGGGGALLFAFSSSILQALQRFRLWSLLNISSNFFRVLALLLLFFLGWLNLTNSLIIYLVIPFIGFIASLFIIPTLKIGQVKNDLSVLRSLYSFGGSVAVFTLIAAVSSKLDSFLVARLLSNNEVGIYAAANQLVMGIPQVASAVGVVLSPRFASFASLPTMLGYFRKAQLLVLGIGLASLLVLPFSGTILTFFYGSVYLPAVVPFIILWISMLVFLISIPVHTAVIYYFGNSKLFVWLSFLHLGIIAILGPQLIVQYGASGAAATVLIGVITNLLLPLVWFLRRIQNES